MVQTAGVRQGFRVVKRPESPRAVAERMRVLFEKREAMDIDRLRRVVRLAEHPDCLTQALLAYFGEALGEVCGHCSRCLGSSAEPEPRSPEPEIGEAEMERVRTLVAERLPALRSPRQLARFLCGLTSPASSRARLTRRDEFGMFEGLRFDKVREWVETLILS